MSEIDTLSQYFARFPGIGSRQAKRFVYFLLSSHPQFAKEMSLRIAALVQKVAQCRECRRYFEPNNPQQSAVCVLCADGVSDKTKLIVVEKDVDLEAVQKSGAYHGRFFILGSLIPLKEIKSPVVSPRIEELKRKIEKNASDGILKEVIFALSATPEGDHTSLELKLFLQPLQEKYGITISSLGRGLSTGSELEYADGETLKSALESRK